MKCTICGNEFEPKTIRSEVCSRKCHDRRKLLRYPEKIKLRNKKYIEEHQDWFNKYHKNYQRRYHHRTYKHRYEENSDRYIEKTFVKNNREALLRIIGTKCINCGKSVQELHHTSYTNLPHDNLIEYSKFLKPLCRKCHKLEHSQKAQSSPK